MKNRDVPITVTFRHLTATDALRSHAESKIAPLLTLGAGATNAHVILSTATHHHRQTAEIVVHGAGAPLTAHAETDDMYQAIDQAAAKLESQVRRRKDRATGTSRRATETVRREPRSADHKA